MDPIEKAIRNALDKGDASDEAFRERVYKSAFSVFERALAGRTSLSPEEAEIRRERFRARIVEIETEFTPAVPAVSESGSRFSGPSGADRAPAIQLDDRFEPRRLDDHDDQPRPVRKKKPALRRFLFLGIAAIVGILLLGILAWWILLGGSSGANRESGAATLPDPAATMEAPPERDWISIFAPEDSTNVGLSGNATAEIIAEEGRAYLRLRGDGQSEARFDIGRGILEQMAGRKSLISILARAGDGEAVKIAVECSLDELGDCGRKRFEIGPTLAEFLFELEAEDGTPRQAGTILLRPAIEGGESVVDIQGIRVAVTAP